MKIGKLLSGAGGETHADKEIPELDFDKMTAWRLIGLYIYCILLAAAAAAFAAAIATAPYWVWPNP